MSRHCFTLNDTHIERDINITMKIPGWLIIVDRFNYASVPVCDVCSAVSCVSASLFYPGYHRDVSREWWLLSPCCRARNARIIIAFYRLTLRLCLRFTTDHSPHKTRSLHDFIILVKCKHTLRVVRIDKSEAWMDVSDQWGGGACGTDPHSMLHTFYPCQTRHKTGNCVNQYREYGRVSTKLINYCY